MAAITSAAATSPPTSPPHPSPPRHHGLRSRIASPPTDTTYPLIITAAAAIITHHHHPLVTATNASPSPVSTQGCWSFSRALCSKYDDVTPPDTYSVQAPSGGVTDWYQSQGYREPGRISR
ncbi:hypothetical protein Tco_0038218 [Tanacetum coccineum]